MAKLALRHRKLAMLLSVRHTGVFEASMASQVGRKEAAVVVWQ